MRVPIFKLVIWSAHKEPSVMIQVPVLVSFRKRLWPRIHEVGGTKPCSHTTQVDDTYSSVALSVWRMVLNLHSHVMNSTFWL